MTSKFSGRTIAALARALASILYSHAEFDLLFVEHEVQEFDTGGNLKIKALNLMRGIKDRYDPETSDRVISQLIESLMQKSHYSSGPEVQGLLAALEADDFAYRDGRLLPTTPEPAALAPQISGLELDLDEFGFQTALAHYRQATDTFADGNLEACNGQIRSYIEDLIIGLCEHQVGKSFGDPSAALQHLRDVEKLDYDEWNLARSFWNAIQDNGPHRGLSYPEEARFRLHVGTALGRYLVDKLLRQADA